MLRERYRYKDRILSRPNLTAAWEDVQSKKGAPGPDDITVPRWRRNWEANIERLIEQVSTNTYYPNRPKRITVLKKNGNFRELSLLTVTDKVLQRAFLNVVEPEFEQRFLNCSHGYRKNRSTATAIQQLLTNRDKGLVWLLDADILGCFDHIDHEILINLFSRVIKEHFVIELLKKWLLAGRRHRHQAVGIPQGAVISPLLCNIYLHQLDARLTSARWNYIRYADDFVVMTTSIDKALQAKTLVSQSLTALRLVLHPEKTNIVSFEHGFTYLGVEFLKSSYRYLWQNKRIQVKGKDLKILYRYMPEFYSRGR